MNGYTVRAGQGAVFARNFIAAAVMTHMAFSTLEYYGQPRVGHGAMAYLAALELSGICVSVLLCGPLLRVAAATIRTSMSYPAREITTLACARVLGVLARAGCELLFMVRP
jgi:hypothetical protein